MRRPSWLSTHLAALRALLVLTVLLGLAYPLAVLAVSQLPGLQSRADGSLVHRASSPAPVGSRLVGQSFTDADGAPLAPYFQTRPSAAGDGYDPTATSASNLGPEDVVDTEDQQSLLTQVCARSVAVGHADGVDGRRPFCTTDGVGAVLAVFHAEGFVGPVVRVVSVNQACPAAPFLTAYEGVKVECATPGEDLTGSVTTPVRGDAPAVSAVPADAVTASGSGLDPQISPAYAAIQVARVAAARSTTPADVTAAVERHTTGRALGFLGEPTVDVVELNLELDDRFPVRG
jgi:potassium-transporting ATPase KdpC subunit